MLLSVKSYSASIAKDMGIEQTFANGHQGVENAAEAIARKSAQYVIQQPPAYFAKDLTSCGVTNAHDNKKKRID